MKKWMFLFGTLFVFLLAGCSDDDPIGQLVLKSQNATVAIGEEVVFEVTFNGESIPDAVISINETPIDGYTHIFTAEGSYRVVAAKKGYNDSEPLYISAEELKLIMPITEFAIEERGYVEIFPAINAVSQKHEFSFVSDNPAIAEVEVVGDRYFVNGNSLGGTRIEIRYGDLSTRIDIAVLERDVPLDFNFIAIVDNQYAFPYMKLYATREEQAAAEEYIDKYLRKYSSEFRRKPLETDGTYLHYRSDYAFQQRKGFIETMYGAAQQGWLAGFESLNDARELLDEVFLSRGFEPIDPSMYYTEMWPYVHRGDSMLAMVMMSEFNELDESVIWIVTGPFFF